MKKKEKNFSIAEEFLRQLACFYLIAVKTNASKESDIEWID